MICRSCKTPNEAGARYCNNCGATLNSFSASAEAETAAMTSEVTAEARKSKSDPLIGLSIDGRYRIDSVIGRGGMGTVYRATRLLIGDEVAIKVLHTGHVTDSHAAERFRREARAAARLKHPNAVSIYDFGVSSGGLQYLVMDLVEGKSLREVNKEQGSLNISLITEITSQVCAALDEAHRQHIVHRDIKPDNIILNFTPAGLRVKVLDFGIAKLRDDTASHLTQTGSVMGTPHYMSPEQCLGEELDNRADIYSMGIVLYEMLCGRVPFNSPVSTAVVVQHVSQPPPSLRAINPNVSAAIEAVVLHAIEKSRDARPATAGTLANELTRALFNANAPAVSYSGFSPPVLPSFQPDVNLSEETVERDPSKAPSQPQQDLPKTIHLGVSSLVAGRQTEGETPAVTTSVKRVVPVKYLGIGLGILGSVMLIALFIWFSRNKINRNEVTLPNTNSSQDADQGVSSTDRDRANNGGKQSPPVGMVLVSGGQFLMGSNESDPDAQPAHTVTVKSFYLDIHEVTRQKYKEFIDKAGHRPPTDWRHGNYPEGTDQLPVTSVSWEDAFAYARWAGKRLPTEEEWEFAARGNKSLRYPWGNQWKSRCANADGDGAARQGFANVGSYDCPSPFGAQDLIGNAWEWTASDWAPYPGGRLAIPAKTGEKVIRGGSWESSRNYATSTYRSGFKGVGGKAGLRCAKNMP